MQAQCPDCDWTMQAEDDDDAADMLELHRIVKMNTALNTA